MVENGNRKNGHSHAREVTVVVASVSGLKTALAGSDRRVFVRGRFQLPLAPGVALTCTVRRGSPLTSFAETEALIVALSGRLERADADRKRRFFAWVRASQLRSGFRCFQAGLRARTGVAPRRAAPADLKNAAPETVQALERKRADAVRELEETYAGVVRDRDEAYGKQRDRSFTEEKEALEAALRDGHGRDREALERQHGEHLEKLRSRTRELEEAAADAERRHADGLAEVERHHVSERRRELAARDDAHTDALESSEAALATRHRAAMDEQAESHRALYEAQATTHRAALDAQASSHQVAMETLASSHKAAFEKQVANHKQLMDDHTATHEETSRVRDSVRDDSYGKQLGQMRESHAVAVEAMRRGHDQRPVVTTFFPEQQLVGHDEALKTEKQMTVDAKDREHGAAVLHALRERDEAHAAERQALEDASHAEKDRAHDERLAAALGSMRDDHDAALGSMRDDHDAARAEDANARARRVVGRWLHRLLSEGWNKWRTSVRVATVAEMREQHAREIAALRNAARAEDANARARRVVGRWLHRLLSEGWNKWRTSAREATHAAALAEAARVRDGQTAAEHAEAAAARERAFDDERSTLEEELVTTLVERHAKELEKRNAEHAILVANCERSARAELDCRRGCEEDLRVKHKEALADQAKKHAAALQERDNEDEAHEIEKDELDLFLMCKSERELDARSSAYDRELASKDEQFRALEAELRADREHFASQLAELEARHTAEMEERMAELEESHFEAMNEAVCSVAADKDRSATSPSRADSDATERHREELELAAERHDATMASVALAELMLFCWRIHLCF
ncbi:hypothetical protein JL722_9286 [Aureococcus anophagefferens]|nr:hypothetical protein JL722_9286 [Aureococcus anophagefferens]